MHGRALWHANVDARPSLLPHSASLVCGRRRLSAHSLFFCRVSPTFPARTPLCASNLLWQVEGDDKWAAGVRRGGAGAGRYDDGGFGGGGIFRPPRSLAVEPYQVRRSRPAAARAPRAMACIVLRPLFACQGLDVRRRRLRFPRAC